jgi:predicted HTH transcriptional regulator
MNKNTAASIEQKYIKRLIAEGEHQQLDFKFEISDSRKIARTIVAFANTDGGKLLIGVKDNGAITGIRSEEEYYMVEAAMSLYCKPQIHFKTKKWAIDGKTILEVTIPRSNKLSYSKDENGKWLAYVRVNDENILANRIFLEVWKRKLKPRGTLIEYSKNENGLLSYLSKNEEISLQRFTRLFRLSRSEAENILINLLSLDVIKMRFTVKGALYSLQNS